MAGSGSGTEQAAGDHVLTFTTTVNGTQVEARVPAHRTLLDFLRRDLSLTGTKLSCDVEVCGACTVLLDGAPVSSCTTLAWEARGKRVETIEGLAEGERLHPLQQAFIDHGAFQCGFCTPGMIMGAKAMLAEFPDPTREQIQWYLKGNLCRCTGYKKIVEAIQAAAAEMRRAGSP